jgi:DNA recombination protein RmuC
MADFSVVALFISALLIGGVLGALFMLFRIRQTGNESITRMAALETELKLNKDQLQQREQALTSAQAAASQMQAEVARLQQAREADAEKLQWVEQAQQRMREAFEALASQSLQTNSTTFIARASEQVQALLGQVRGDWNTQKAEMHGLVDPLQQNLDTLDQRVREMEQKREGAYQRVDEQLRQLMTTNADLQRTTITLSQALKSSSVRGRWGELQLRRIAELSGMHENISFAEQVGVEEGRPDMVVYLPNGGSIPIDSKTPMTAFIESVEASDEGTRLAKMADHVRAVRSRVQELGQKKYWEKFDHAPDFVIMFMPSEACLSAAFDADPRLMEDALNLKVMVVTPITLLALLKAVAYGWQQHRINDEARQIAEEGREFYRRLKIFVDYLADMRSALNKTVEHYNKAIGSLEGRLLPSVRKLESMANVGKTLESPIPIEVSARLVNGQLTGNGQVSP